MSLNKCFDSVELVIVVTCICISEKKTHTFNMLSIQATIMVFRLKQHVVLKSFITTYVGGIL